MTKIPGKSSPQGRTRIPVSTNFYSGRTSHGGADGLGKYNEDAHLPQTLGDPEVTQRAKNYGGDTPNGWLRGSGKGVPGVTDERPHFDNDTTRKGNDAPLLKGGGKDGSRNHFSAAHNGGSKRSGDGDDIDGIYSKRKKG
jgi:hypothetical protein